MSYSSVVFDLDYTLYDEEKYFQSAFEDIAGIVARQREIDQADAYERILTEFREKGSQYTRFFDHVASLFELDSSHHDKFYQLYLTTAPELSLYPDAERILDWLSQREYQLGLVTNGSAKAQRNKIDALGLEPRFDAICVARELGDKYEKPHINPYLDVLTELESDGANSIYVGDNPHNDFVGAKKVGMVTVRLRRGEFREDAGDNEIIDHTIEDLTALKSLVRG